MIGHAIANPVLNFERETQYLVVFCHLFFLVVFYYINYLEIIYYCIRMEKVKYIKDICIIRDGTHPGILAVKATGIAALKQLIAPVLVSREGYNNPTADGIFELDFVLGSTGNQSIDVEMEVDVVFRLKKIPSWIKGIKVNAAENSDIELI